MGLACLSTRDFPEKPRNLLPLSLPLTQRGLYLFPLVLFFNFRINTFNFYRLQPSNPQVLHACDTDVTVVFVKNKHRAPGNEEKAQLGNISNIEHFCPHTLLCSLNENGREEWRYSRILGTKDFLVSSISVAHRRCVFPEDAKKKCSMVK